MVEFYRLLLGAASLIMQTKIIPVSFRLKVNVTVNVKISFFLLNKGSVRFLQRGSRIWKKQYKGIGFRMLKTQLQGLQNRDGLEKYRSKKAHQNALHME